MPLSPGTSLGPYQIDAPLGAGGMGEVYQATDTKLKRQVALKILPEAFDVRLCQPAGRPSPLRVHESDSHKRNKDDNGGQHTQSPHGTSSWLV